MKNFLKDRLKLAHKISYEKDLVHYSDIALILCTVLSACSSYCWPNKKNGIDKKRFIELLITRSREDFRTSWVSIPNLINLGEIQEDQTEYKGGNSARIFCDEEIDLSYYDTLNNYPKITEKLIKKSCYASLIYEELRCGYAHEYWHGQNMTHIQPSRKNARVSYIGRLENDRSIKRMIFFHLDYLFKITEYHVNNLPENNLPEPEKWWIE